MRWAPLHVQVPQRNALQQLDLLGTRLQRTVFRSRYRNLDTDGRAEVAHPSNPVMSTHAPRSRKQCTIAPNVWRGCPRSGIHQDMRTGLAENVSSNRRCTLTP